MGQLEIARVQRADDAQRFSHDDILGVLAADLRLEAIRDPRIRQTLDTLRQRSLEDHVERELVVAGGQRLRLVLAGIFEGPGLVVKDPFPQLLARVLSDRGRKVPAGGIWSV